KEGDEEGLGDDLFKEAETGDTQEKLTDPYTRKMNKLQTDLKTAIDSEDYEKAASLRDEIKKLEISR
ncbi:MAG: hypothetical protein HOP31_13370, partial [Ignavibacteria bacterium]|nr:hypothetical protein [Ignavibacteria bacterium]